MSPCSYQTVGLSSTSAHLWPRGNGSYSYPVKAKPFLWTPVTAPRLICESCWGRSISYQCSYRHFFEVLINGPICWSKDGEFIGLFNHICQVVILRKKKKTVWEGCVFTPAHVRCICVFIQWDMIWKERTQVSVQASSGALHSVSCQEPRPVDGMASTSTGQLAPLAYMTW